MSLRHGKINLSKLRSTSIEMVNGKRCVCIPIEENHLMENYKHDIYLSFVSFPTDKIKPYDLNIINSVPEKFRDGRWEIGGWKSE